MDFACSRYLDNLCVLQRFWDEIMHIDSVDTSRTLCAPRKIFIVYSRILNNVESSVGNMYCTSMLSNIF